MLRIQAPLRMMLEDLVHKTIGCCIAVHRALGPGTAREHLLESGLPSS